MAKLQSPKHIKLRDYRVTPEHLKDFEEKLEEIGIAQFFLLEKFAHETDRLLNGIYSQGFEDGQAAALLDLDQNSG